MILYVLLEWVCMIDTIETFKKMNGQSRVPEFSVIIGFFSDKHYIIEIFVIYQNRVKLIYLFSQQEVKCPLSTRKRYE